MGDGMVGMLDGDEVGTVGELVPIVGAKVGDAVVVDASTWWATVATKTRRRKRRRMRSEQAQGLDKRNESLILIYSYHPQVSETFSKRPVQARSFVCFPTRTVSDIGGRTVSDIGRLDVRNRSHARCNRKPVKQTRQTNKPVESK